MILQWEDLELLFGVGFTFIVAVAVIGIVLNIILMVWVYKDAEKRGMGGALWLIIVFLAGCIGCLIYLIVRGNHPAQ
jgi:hypothetical protein